MNLHLPQEIESKLNINVHTNYFNLLMYPLRITFKGLNFITTTSQIPWPATHATSNQATHVKSTKIKRYFKRTHTHIIQGKNDLFNRKRK